MIALLQDFWRHVEGRAHFSSHGNAWLKHARQAKVDSFQRCLIDRALRHEHKVLRLDVPVTHKATVHVLHRIEDLPHEDRDLGLPEAVGPLHLVEELPALAQLHHQERPCRVLEALQKPDDVRMLHHGQDICLQMHLVLGDKFRRHAFDGARRAGVVVDRLGHVARDSGAHLLLEGVEFANMLDNPPVHGVGNPCCGRWRLVDGRVGLRCNPNLHRCVRTLGARPATHKS
mmetsp:Transcript_57648/g.187294  ORF Transcript_57648/g.187294 Transcript_57648/m.187294 type:complete len:230 (-) Transcript_57648:165-854(-)